MVLGQVKWYQVGFNRKHTHTHTSTQHWPARGDSITFYRKMMIIMIKCLNVSFLCHCRRIGPSARFHFLLFQIEVKNWYRSSGGTTSLMIPLVFFLYSILWQLCNYDTFGWTDDDGNNHQNHILIYIIGFQYQFTAGQNGFSIMNYFDACLHAAATTNIYIHVFSYVVESH